MEVVGQVGGVAVDKPGGIMFGLLDGQFVVLYVGEGALFNLQDGLADKLVLDTLGDGMFIDGCESFVSRFLIVSQLIFNTFLIFS